MRTRLVVAVVALSALMFLVVGPLWLVLLREYLIGQSDRQLDLAAQRASAVYLHDQQARPPATSSALRFLGLSGQVDGTVAAVAVAGRVTQAGRLDADGVTRDLRGAESQVFDDLPPDGLPHLREIGALGHYQLLAEPMPGDVAVVVGLPLHQLNDTIGRLAEIVSFVALAGVIAAGPASAAVIGATLRPLRRLATTASRVSQLTLDRGDVPLAERVGTADADPRTEVGQVGIALNSMIEHVTSALTLRQAGEMNARVFLADASHELRTPLAAIHGYAELATRGGDEVPAELRQLLGRIVSQAERMSSLVEDMLLLARIDAGRPLVRERVDLSQLLIDAISDAHASGLGHRWELALPADEVVTVGDGVHLAQVMSNLLGNARVHTPPGTVVHVELTDSVSELVLTVSDNGPGIPAELLPHVFGRFARGDTSRSREAGSTGLGLAIARAVVTAHAGTITAESGSGNTTFTVRLPKVALDVADGESGADQVECPAPDGQPGSARTSTGA